jgi:hypothetical protein
MPEFDPPVPIQAIETAHDIIRVAGTSDGAPGATAPLIPGTQRANGPKPGIRSRAKRLTGFASALVTGAHVVSPNCKALWTRHHQLKEIFISISRQLSAIFPIACGEFS